MRLREHDVIEVDGLAAAVRRGIHAGQGEQVVSEPGAPFRLREHLLGVCVVGFRVPRRKLELRAQRGDRAAQLMRRVRDELPLPVGCGLDPAEQVVESACEAAELIPGARALVPPASSGQS